MYCYFQLNFSPKPVFPDIFHQMGNLSKSFLKKGESRKNIILDFDIFTTSLLPK